MCKAKINKWPNHKFGDLGLFAYTVLFATVFLFLTGCKTDENDLELPGRLLLRDNDKIVILSGFGKIEAEFDLLAYGTHWSPDGQRIVFRDSGSDISILELETGQKTRLFADQAPFYPHVYDWSPNGREITFIETLHDEQSLGLYVVNAVGVFDPRLVWKCEHQCDNFQWSSDEQHIFISERLPYKDRQSSSRVMKVNVHTGVANMVFMLDVSIDAMRWDPKEKQVAIVSYNEGTFLFNKNGQLQKLITADDVGGLYWSPDGKWLAFNQVTSDPRPKQVANVYNVETGETQRFYPRGVGSPFEKAPHPYVLGWHE